MTDESHRARAFERASVELAPGAFITVFEDGRAVDHRVVSLIGGMIQTPIRRIDPLDVIEIDHRTKPYKRYLVSFRDDAEAHLAEMAPLLEKAREAGQ